MDLQTQRLMAGAAGAAGAAGDPIGVEQVFKSYVYTGTGTGGSGPNSTNVITTGLDMSGDGGMVWIKNRENNSSHGIWDSVRGAGTTSSGSNCRALNSNSALKPGSSGGTMEYLSAFNNNGFTLAAEDIGPYNANGDGIDFVSWSFKEQSKFFDIVSYSGTGNANTEISHNLGSVPGCIIVKCISHDSTDWRVYHRSVGNTTALTLNGTANPSATAAFWSNTTPTATHFTVGTSLFINGSGRDYIAYLFAHEEAEFGPNADQEIISCGSWTGNGSAGNKVTLPFEPGFILWKCYDTAEHWRMVDSSRGVATASTGTGGNDFAQSANGVSGDSNGQFMDFLPDGFKLMNSWGDTNASNQNYAFIAIAAETGKTMMPITTGTDVFAMDTGNGSSTAPAFNAPSIKYRTDMRIGGTGGNAWYLGTRFMYQKHIKPNSTTSEMAGSWSKFDYSLGDGANWDSSYWGWMWRRYAGLDIVPYIGDGNTSQQISHSLSQTPQMMWCKSRTSGVGWAVYHIGLNGGTNPEEYNLQLENGTDEESYTNRWNDTAPTASAFTVGSSSRVNSSGEAYIAFLFASVDGVCKVGSYSGSNSTVTVTTGFQPRFVLIKRATGTGQWTMFDTFRGWGSGNDQKLELSDDGNQTNNYDAGAPTSTGFTVTSGQSAINNNGDTYVYYCHA